MAERSQYQYTPVTGPVWREPIADLLAWLPEGNPQPARALPRGAIDWSVYYVQPITPAAYDPSGLDWQPEDAYSARTLARAKLDWSLYPLQPPAVGYDPRDLAWLPSAQAPARSSQPNKLGAFSGVEFAALYRPQDLQWATSDQYSGRPPARARNDWTQYPLQPPAVGAYDPSKLEWIPSAQQPARNHAPRSLGHFAPVQFSALYQPAGLQWTASDRYAGRYLPRGRNDYSIYPLQPPVPFNPSGLQWVSSDRYAGRALERARNDWTFYPLQDVAAPLVTLECVHAEPTIRAATISGTDRTATFAAPDRRPGFSVTEC